MSLEGEVPDEAGFEDTRFIPVLTASRRRPAPTTEPVFSQPDMKAMFIDDILVGTRHHAVAPILGLIQFSRDWGFRLADITVPVRLWQGDADRIVPTEHAQHLAARLPDTQLRICPDESHLGVMAAAEEIFAVLLDLWT